MRKNLALVLALVMILSLVPMTAFAATTNSVDRVPTVGEDFEFVLSDAPVLTLEPKIGDEFDATFTFRLNLTNAEFREELDDADDPVEFENFKADHENLLGYEVTKRTKTSYNITITPDDVNADGNVVIYLTTKVLDEGEARVTIDPLGSKVSSGTFTFAVVAAGDTIATVTGSEKLGRGTADAGTILIDEASVSALKVESQIFRLRLPRDVEWDTETAENMRFEGLVLQDLGVAAGDTVNALGYDWTAFVTDDGDQFLVRLANSGRDMFVWFEVDAISNTRGTIVIPTVIDIDRSASFGDIEVSIKGEEGQISDASGLKIAEYVDYGIAVDVDEVIEMYAGRYDEDYEVTIEIETDLEFSLAENRWVEFELPTWAAFVEGDADRVSDHIREFQVMDGSEDEYEFTFTIVAEGTAVPMGEMSRDLEMTISGAGIEETVIKVADVLAPVSVEVGVQEELFSIGTQRQMAPEIIITENYVGAIMEGDIVLSVLDQFVGSMRFDDVEYEVLEGDLEVDDVEIGDDDESLVIIVDVQSDEEAAVIRLYNIEMTLDRTVPMGVFRLNIGGDALIDYGDMDEDDWDFAGRVARFDFITVGTPVDPTLVDMEAAQVAFTVGQMAYWVDGEMMMMDVAPFISDGRLMIPVRYLEELFGMQPVWNGTTRTVTVMYNDAIYQMTIGSNTITVNGVPVFEMDAEAMIVDSRTFVPASRFARAMGIPYVWDAATQTVTFN